MVDEVHINFRLNPLERVVAWAFILPLGFYQHVKRKVAEA